MKNRFPELFQNITAESLSVYCAQQQTDSRRYQEAQSRFQEIWQTVVKTVGKKEPRIEEYEPMDSVCVFLECQWSYEKGMQDCVYLLQQMGLLPRK